MKMIAKGSAVFHLSVSFFPVVLVVAFLCITRTHIRLMARFSETTPGEPVPER